MEFQLKATGDYQSSVLHITNHFTMAPYITTTKIYSQIKMQLFGWISTWMGYLGPYLREVGYPCVIKNTLNNFRDL